MRASRAAVTVAGLAAAAAIGLALAPRREEVRPAPGNERAGAVSAAPARETAAREADAEAPLPPLPASLAGTDPGGGLRVDAAGRFVPGREALDLFDYYFSASGEEPDETIVARIRAEIRRRLTGAAAQQAEAFLAQYLAYRAAAEELFASEPASGDLERRFQRIREIRREAFGAAVAADLFAEEEAITAVDLERRRVARDETLPPEERERRLAALDAELPDAERAARAEARQVLDLRAAETALRAAGASPSDIQAERERRVGPEAAARLAALDEQRAGWNARVAAYRTERDALRARGLPPAELGAELASLRAARFSAAESVRVEALERTEARSTGGAGGRE